ncbi:MAG TPA: hypothetical protein VHS57_02295, partial [Acidimicrobiales bacterium]|nr:hypothetical protein [Acidimicrobiales bacterium]
MVSARVRRRRLQVAIATVLAVALLAESTWYDIHTHARAEHEQSTLAAADRHLAGLHHGLNFTDFANALTTAKRNGLQASIASTLGQTSSVDSSLSSTNTFASKQDIGITTLHTCLGGVQNALGQISANNNAQAAKDIS